MAPSTDAAPGRRWPLWFLAVLAGGLVVRLALIASSGTLGPRIEDEKQYVQLAESLYEGRGFAWASGERTSLRPPLYPALVAGVWHVAGRGNLQAVRFVQCLLGLLTAAMIVAIGRRAFDARIGRIAAAIVWLYPSFIYLNVTLLSETLFTFLLVLFLLLATALTRPSSTWTAIACGAALALGALTRSVLWPLPLALCPLLFVVARGTARRRMFTAAAVFAGYVVVIAPWAVRNTRLQGVPEVVDTMGGMNLRMGNYEYTPEDRMWDAVSLTGEESWIHALNTEHVVPPDGVFTEGMKDKWAQRKALAYIAAHPGTTLRRSVIKFGDLWGLDRSYAAGLQQGLYHPPAWFGLPAALAMLASSGLIILAGAAGIWLARPDWRSHLVLLLPIVAVTAVHALVFGHPRYHDPLIPILSLYAAALAARPAEVVRRAGRWSRTGAILTLVVLVGFWARQIAVVDGARVRAFVSRVI
jgi:4-amino-4-deoxy-L-arabinose transferase-like glycosyltransferase